MIISTLIWVLMPIAIALGIDLSRGIGVQILWNERTIGVYPAMLPWLAPLSLATTVSGLLLYYGRAPRLALAVSLIWVGIGLAAALDLAVVAGIVALCIFTGTRLLENEAATVAG